MAKEVLMTKRISTLLEELIEAASTMVQAGIPCVAVKPGAKEPVASSEGGWLIIEDEGCLEETLSNAY